MFLICACILTVQKKTCANYFAKYKEPQIYWQKDWPPHKELLPGTSSPSLMPPRPPSHCLFPTTPCYRTNSTRWRTYQSTSDSQSSQASSSSREDDIQVNLSRLFRPYTSNSESGAFRENTFKGKKKFPGAIIFPVSLNQRALFCQVSRTQGFWKNVVWAANVLLFQVMWAAIQMLLNAFTRHTHYLEVLGDSP